jgi:hypothetical protein
MVRTLYSSTCTVAYFGGLSFILTTANSKFSFSVYIVLPHLGYTFNFSESVVFRFHKR